MWLRRTISRARIHNETPPTFACSSFKDIRSLIFDEESSGDVLASPKRPPICHRARSVKSLSALSQTTFPENMAAAVAEEPDPEVRIRGAEKIVVVYFTSLRIVRRTYEDCKAVRSILSAFRVPIEERDLSMDSRFMVELQRILGLSKISKLTLPRVFIGGRYIGGVEDVRRLHESDELKKYLERLPFAGLSTCDTCGGHRFIICVECSGSHKCCTEKAGFGSCTLCNENGLIRCPSCSYDPFPSK